jgi:hypothetical protein
VPYGVSKLAALAQALITLGLAEVLRLAIRAVDCAKIFGEGQHQYMNAVSNLGLMYYTQSRLTEAHEQWISALEMGKKPLRFPGYIDTGIGNQLALLYYQEGRKQILEKRAKYMGEHHPETLGARGSLATSYSDQGLLEMAELL